MMKMRAQPRRRSAARSTGSRSATRRASSRGWLSRVAFRNEPGSCCSATSLRGGCDSSLLLQQLEDGALLLEHLQLLDVDRMKRRQRQVVLLGPRVLSFGNHVLPDDDDGQEHKLQEGLADQNAERCQERVACEDRDGAADCDQSE